MRKGLMPIRFCVAVVSAARLKSPPPHLTSPHLTSPQVWRRLGTLDELRTVGRIDDFPVQQIQAVVLR